MPGGARRYFAGMHSPDVIVVGGGIVGAAAAERLARGGAKVTLLERGRIGGEASWAAAGLLTPVHPWRHPETLLRLEAESLRMWPEAAARVADAGFDLELRRTGLLALVESDDDARECDVRLAWLRGHGERCERLDAAALRAAEPAVAASVRGALHLPDLMQIRNHRAAPGFAEAARRAGAAVVEGRGVRALAESAGRVTGVVTDDGATLAAGEVVLAAGAWTGALLGASCPPALRTVPCRGQMVLYRTAPGTVRHMILSSGDYLVPRSDGRVLAGSTVEWVGFDAATTAPGIAGIRAAAARMVPSLAGADVEMSWAGLRPGSPDELPSIGRVRPGLVAATGHFRSGIMLAPVTAELVADIVEGRGAAEIARPFDPLR